MAEVLRPTQDASLAARKKFATPPVKIACLACRASRTRCTGERPCTSCTNKDRPCVYEPSRRGGPRTRKKPRLLKVQNDPALIEPEPEPITSTDLPVESWINPGAGLKNLTEAINDSDVLFESLFSNPAQTFLSPSSPNHDQSRPMARSYANDQAVLNAYYIWIHPYFPILPSPECSLTPDNAVPMLESNPMDINESPSPTALAMSAILALIPCAQDPSPFSGESIRFRRKYSQFLAQSALEGIEVESEIPESSEEPARALDDSHESQFRQPIHSNVPLELESIIALNLLSVYEYAQRGNLKRMRMRADAALTSAMSLSLHTYGNDIDVFSEARSRVWWMTYICVCQSAIVSNTKPAFEAFTPSFTALLPTLPYDSEAWPLFIKSQQAILSATQFVIDLNEAMRLQIDMSPIYQRMIDLELFLDPLISASETWSLNCPSTQVVDQQEAVVAQALRGMAKIKLGSARIKLHRYCAFFDLPVFPRKNCDLQSFQTEKGQPELPLWPSCCSTLVDGSANSTIHSHSSPSLSMSSTPTAMTSDPGVVQTHIHAAQAPPTQPPVFPFSSHQSAKICLKSALSIAQVFELLPYPNPSAAPPAATPTPVYLGPLSGVVAPRTMPSFACCAMQSAYVLLMVDERTRSVYATAAGGGADSADFGTGGGGALLADNLLGRLQQGLLSILGTLENYGTAFEALCGMRDQIRDKVYPSMATPCHS